MRFHFGWYQILCSGTVKTTPMPSCDSPLVPLMCAVTVLLILQTQLSFVDRVYDHSTFLDASASTKG